MKISSNNSYLPNYNYNYNNQISTKNNVSFQGKMDILKYAFNKDKIRNEEFFYNNVSSFLDVSEKSLKKFTERFKRYKMDFIYTLAHKYNIDKSKMSSEAQKESKEILFGIYDKVKYPNNTYKKLILDTNYNFRQIDKIIDLTSTQNNSQQLALADNLLDVYRQENGRYTLPYKIMEDFLSTPSSKHISKNFEDYKPFIQLNIEDPEVVSKLEEEIQKGYNKTKFLRKLNIEETTKYSSILTQMNPALFEKNYNETGINLLKQIDQIYAPIAQSKKDVISKKTDLLWEIYNSTNENNAPLRRKIAKYAIRRINFENRLKDASIDSLIRIYRNIDNSPEANKFVNKALDDGYRLQSFENIEKTITKGNLTLINRYPEEVKEYLWHNNGAAGFSIEDVEEINKQYKKHKKKSPISFKERIKSMFSLKGYQNLYFDGTRTFKQKSMNQNKLNIIENAKKLPEVKEKYTSKTYVSTPISCAKKKNIIEKINGIIDSKLARMNTEEQLWQKRDYAIKATKIRLNLLNDMFKSVKDTRITDRGNGKKPSVSNKDVLRLYEAVNGKNAKEVKRMLKETDSKGNRKFNILEIAEIFEKKNKEENLKKLHRNNSK